MIKQGQKPPNKLDRRTNNLMIKIEVEASIRASLQRVRTSHRSIEKHLELALESAEKETAQSRLKFLESKKQ